MQLKQHAEHGKGSGLGHYFGPGVPGHHYQDADVLEVLKRLAARSQGETNPR